MSQFDLIVQNNPVISEIVERLLSEKKSSKKELIKLLLEATDQNSAQKALSHFLANREDLRVE